jgi:uroporphyrinogen III methyltransferase/synthase
LTSLKPRSVGVVITRSREGNEELAMRLKLIGLDPITVDTISLAPPSDWNDVDRLLSQLRAFDWVVFTSPSGAKYFGTRMRVLSLPLPWEGSPRVAAVGQQTARALSSLGVKPDFIPSSYTTRVLGEELPAEKGARILLLRSDIADRGLANRLAERGFSVEEAAIYRTLPVMGPSPKIKDANLIVFASPSAVKGFCALVTDDELRMLKRLKAVCIGPVTESAARESGFLNTTRPESFTLDAVVREITRLSQGDA